MFWHLCEGCRFFLVVGPLLDVYWSYNKLLVVECWLLCWTCSYDSEGKFQCGL